MSLRQPIGTLKRTKTLATVGPASASRETLVQLIDAGVDVFRLNMAHGTRESHERAIDDIRWAADQMKSATGILIDLAGPKIRLGNLLTDPLYLKPDDELTFVRGDEAKSAYELTCSYESLIDDVRQGDIIMLADGTVQLKVVRADGDSADCLVLQGGDIRSRQGVNLPRVDLQVDALGEVDRDNAVWAASKVIDFISLSFVRSAQDMIDLKQLLARENCPALVVAKIEKHEALDNLMEIIQATDVVMVARGDLGVEIGVENTPVAQKRIIEVCQQCGRPVIVATQMLESMHHARQPTRAEVSDVANAILDGADACMMSGETAVGKYPVDSAQMMSKIMRNTEQMLYGRPSRHFDSDGHEIHDVSEAVVYGAAQIARKLEARCVVIATSTGDAALVKSLQRDFIPSIGLTNRIDIFRRMSIFWGITPLITHLTDTEEIIGELIRQTSGEGGISVGDRIVFVIDTDQMPGVQDVVMVREVNESKLASPGE